MKNTLLLFLLLFSTHIAWAQSALEISLIDVQNKPVANYELTIANEQIGFKSVKTTNEQGKVRLNGLSSSGTYSISAAENDTYYGQVLPGIVLVSNKTTTVSIALLPKGQTLGEVVISADAQPVSINTVDGEVASEMTKKEIQALPIEGRDITRVLYRLPNISLATGFFPEAPNVSINGANSLYTSYQIDGLDNNENFLGGQRFAMPMGFTKSVTALTNNFGAEHGLTSNGVINITTQSGTNTTSGEVFFVNRPGPALDAPSRYAQRDLSGNQVKDGYQRYQMGFALGGALKKDKTFYYVNVEHTTDLKDNLLNVPQLGINQTVRGKNQFTYFSGKIDQHWSEKFRSALRMNVGIVGIERQGGGLDGGISFPSSGNKQDRNSVNIALKNTYQGQNFTYEANYLYGRFRWNYANPENNNSPDVTVQDPTGISIAYLGHPGYVFDDLENTHLLQNKATFFKNNHTIKAGIQLKSSGFELFGGGNPNGSYLVKLNANELNQVKLLNKGSGLTATDIPSTAEVLRYGVELRPASFKKAQNIFSAYIEDQISVSARLNLNVGLRYDYDNLSKGGAKKGDLNNIAPRLSANYKLSKNTSMRVGYGMYYDKILYSIYSDARQSSTNSADYQTQLQALVAKGALPANTDIAHIINNGNFTASANNVNYLQGPSAGDLQGRRDHAFAGELRVLNPNGYKNPYSHQFMLGLQHKVNASTMFYVDLIHNRSYNLFRLKDLNAPTAYNIDPNNVVVRTQAQADATRAVPIYADEDGNYGLINGQKLRGVARSVVMTESAGRSNYTAANFTLQHDRAEGQHYSYRLMYTLSFLENNTEDINFRAMDANNYKAEWGPSINDRTHIMNGIFSYYPLKNWTVTLAALLQSGQPINRVPDASLYGTSDLNGDGRSFGDAYVGNSDRAPGESRNSDRLPWSNTFDVSTFYQLKMGGNSRVEIGAYIFNILNAENLSGYANNATQSNQIQPGPISSGILIRRNSAPPRQFQFSVRYLF